MANDDKEHKITILINNKPYVAPKPAMTGREIKELAGEPLDSMLFLIIRSPDKKPGEDDKLIKDDDVEILKSGMQFRIIPPSTFGLN